MHVGIDRINPGQVVVGEFPRGHLPVCQLLTPFGDRHGQDLRAAETLSVRCVRIGLTQPWDSIVNGSERRQRTNE